MNSSQNVLHSSGVQRHASQLLCLILVCSLLASGCASLTGKNVSAQQAEVTHTTTRGVIVQLDRAYIENNPSLWGGLGGAVVGAIAGSAVGGGSGRVLMGVSGAALGALVGAGIERRLNRRDGIDITLRLETGETIAVVQELGPEERAMRPGDRVVVLRGSDGSARVRR